MAAAVGRRRRTTTHFFKVLIPGFHQRLNLPSAVSKEVEEEHTSRTATLRSCIGTWKITLSKNSGNNLMCFDQGWPEFVESHALHVGDFLVFEHTGDLDFNVVAFGPSACEKVFDAEKKKEEEEEATKEEEEVEAALNFTTTTTKKRIKKDDDGSPYFVKKMRPSFAWREARVNIPVEFMMRYGLGRRTGVKLRDGKNGKNWSVDISTETSNGYRNRMRGVGWNNFYTSNKIKTGDTCVFRLRRRFTTPTTLFFDVQINHS